MARGQAQVDRTATDQSLAVSAVYDALDGALNGAGCRMPRAGSASLKWRTASRRSVTIALALPVVGQHLDDPALGNPAVVAGDHGLQLIAQGRKPGDLVLHLLEMGLGDLVDLAAGAVRQPGEVEELADSVDLEAERTSVADEVEPTHITGTVPTLLPLRPDRLGQQADLLVVPDRRHLHLGLPGQFANRQGHRRNLLNL